jgi:hypothetical protein
VRHLLGADNFAFGDLIEQFWPHRAVTMAPRGELHRPDARCGRIHGQMDLTPLPSALGSMLAEPQFAITEEPTPGAVNEDVQGIIGASIWDQDDQSFLASAQGGAIRHGPVRDRHLLQAGHHPGR